MKLVKLVNVRQTEKEEDLKVYDANTKYFSHYKKDIII